MAIEGSSGRSAPEAVACADGEGNALLARSDAAWERLRPLVQPANYAELAAIRSFYRDGIPAPWGQAETRAAEQPFDELATLGAKDLSWRPLSWCRRRGWGVARRAAVGRPESDAPRSLFPRASTAAPARAAVMVRIEGSCGCDTYRNQESEP